LPDFQGGLVVFGPVNGDPPYSISRLDGVTGQSVFTYTIGQTINPMWSDVAVHPDGTIFAILGDPYSDDSHPMGQAWVIGVDGSSGAQKFSVPLPDDTAVFSHEPFIMIAGDGYAYVPYVTYSPDTGTQQLKLLRVNSAGASDNIDIKTFTPESENAQLEVGYSSVITNADTGVLLTWGAWNTYSWEPRQPPVPPNTQTYGIAVTTGTGVSVLDAPLVGQVNPALQAQDGSFVGSYGLDMVSFDQSGSVRWIVPNYSPLMATADGGVIATSDYVSATVFDQSGNATGQIANMPTQSWTLNEYQVGSVDQVVAMALLFAPGWSPFAGANASGNGTGYFPMDSISNEKVKEILTPARWQKFAQSHCAAVLGGPQGIPSTMPYYSLQMVQQKQKMTNFYDVGNPGIGNLELQVVTGGQYGSNETLTRYLRTANAATANMGYSRQTAVVVQAGFLSQPYPEFHLIHEVLLHAYAALTDDNVFGLFQANGLWRPAGSTATTTISTWMSTDCSCTPENPATASTCKANTAPW
jgi:hypothetical protein